MTKRIVIHRDRSFEYKGRTYLIAGGGPGTPNASFGYEIYDAATGHVVEDGLFTYADIRSFLARVVENGWPLFEEDDDPTTPPSQQT